MSDSQDGNSISPTLSRRGAVVTAKKRSAPSSSPAPAQFPVAVLPLNRSSPASGLYDGVREKNGSSPYRLRDSSKLPSRYRMEEDFPSPVKTRSPRTKTPVKPASTTGVVPPVGASIARRALGGKGRSSNSSSPSLAGDFPILPDSPLVVPDKNKKAKPLPKITDDSTMEVESESSQYSNSAFDIENAPDETRTVMMKKMARQKSHSDLGDNLRDNLKRLKNMLKLPKARRWVVCEFFYSGVDEQLFLGENEFSQIMKESFPNIKTNYMNKQEWRTIRRNLGKPRRCSATFFREERQMLHHKRKKIRSIYDGACVSDPDIDLSDLPNKLPRPLIVGMRVYARIRVPKDGIYAGTIDAIIEEGYRVVFEKEDMIPPAIVSDYEVILDGKIELVPISYFIEQSTSKLPFGVKLPPQLSMSVKRQERPTSVRDLAIHATKSAVAGVTTGTSGHEKVGNFPVRMLVILVKLSKLIEQKKKLIKSLTDLNTEAERANMMTDTYHPTFQEKYAQVVIDLEALNKQMSVYLNGIQDYHTQLAPQTNHTARPETLRRLCGSHAQQIVKHCNSTLTVTLTNRKSLSLVTSLTSLLLQIRSLGQQKISPLELHTLSESINEIRNMVSPRNAAYFQDYVEVHMKQIHNMMQQSGAITSM